MRPNDQPVLAVCVTYAPGLIGIYWLASEVPHDASPGSFRSLAVTAEAVPGNPTARGPFETPS